MPYRYTSAPVALPDGGGPFLPFGGTKFPVLEARWIVNGKTEGRDRVLGSFIHHRERQSGS
jgi:hypothetical protein